jgi:hypothetical protein
VTLLAGLLRATGVGSWGTAAQELEAATDAASPHAWQLPYVPDAKIVAGALLASPLDTLAEHALREFAVDMSEDETLTDRLARYLRTGFNRDPAPAGPPAFPFRLVPSAAEIAVRSSGDTPDLEAIARRSFDYLRAIPRPQFLAAPPAGRREFLRGLAMQLDVSGGAGE